MKKILLIDDENSIARLVGSMAGDAGYAFAYAEDGAEGLVVAEREAPDLVIMDVMMPRMDGFTTCRLMRERVRVGLGDHDRVAHRHREHGREHDEMHVVHGEVLHEHRAEQRAAERPERPEAVHEPEETGGVR